MNNTIENRVELSGYITNLLNASINADFILSVPKEGDSNQFSYIPVSTNGDTLKNGSLNDCIINKVHVAGKLETYHDTYGRKHWHIQASSIRVVEQSFNPFAPKPTKDNKNTKQDPEE